MFLGYNTNGFAHHRLEDAIEVIAELGYGGVALTPDVHDFEIAISTAGATCYPRNEGLFKTARAFLRINELRCVIETGARFLLDRHQKHQPTLISPQPEQRRLRLDVLKSAVRLAADLGADCVSFWSGTPAAPADDDILWGRLVDGCKRLADYAADRDVRLAFEPEPGMFIDTMDKFAELFDKVNHPHFGLTIDVGHLVCNGELPVSEHLVRWKDVLWNVHVEDMRRGVHDHLMFGMGEVDFADVFRGLREAGYANGVYVELSRHSHDAVNTARKSKAFLDRFIGEPGT
jgi:L-ribulose-5-phosphate 3-epimerase